MYKETIKEFQEDFKSKKVKKRNIKFPFEILDINKIITFVWPRRAGKTYFMFYILQQLIEKKVISIENIVFIDFSAFLDQNFDVKQLLEDFYWLYPDKEPFIVFDEIQELEWFSNMVLDLFNKWYKIFLSWSNSKLLSSELSTQFRWRTYDIRIYPLDFQEFLYFKNMESKEIYGTKKKWKLKNLFNEYLQFGAYPEIALIEDTNIKLALLESYFDILLYKDLLERYGIENEYVLKYLFKKIVLTNTKEFSFTKVFYELKSQNIKVGIQTLYNYLEYLKEIFFVLELNDKYKKKSQKLYLYDVGFTNLINKNNLWQRLENVIYLLLIRKYHNITYISNKHGEVDFVLEKEGIAIQVCYKLNYDNIEREAKSLKKLDIKDKYIIYFDLENKIEIEWLKIISILEAINLF